MTKTSLVKGTAVLAAAGLFVKFLGAFFRIPLANMIGAAGMAGYAPAYAFTDSQSGPTRPQRR